MASNSCRFKRRRTSIEGADCLSDLPVEPLTHVASFLAAPSRALFAVAFSFADQRNERRSAIISTGKWSALDFGEIEKELATKLTDDDLGVILQHIDAANKLEKIRLTNCVNITGDGLEPLRGSTVIQQIDLTLVSDHERQMIASKSLISLNRVLPLLDSIIKQEGCKMKLLQFPYAWREAEEENDRGGGEFSQFLARYNKMWDNRGGPICLTCDQDINGDMIDGVESPLFAAQNYTCCKCLKHYCGSCQINDDRYCLQYCYHCNRHYCFECSEIELCECCEMDFCTVCKEFTECSNTECNSKLCDDCVTNWEGALKCTCCDAIFCSYCYERESRKCLSCNSSHCGACSHPCRTCGESFCRDCFENGDNECLCSLLHAASCGDLATVQRLHERGFDIFRSHTESGMSCILKACKYGHHVLLDYLLEQGADPNDTEHFGSTCIMAAACYRHPECVQRLIAAGADVEYAYSGDNATVIYMTAYCFSLDSSDGELEFENGSVVRTVKLLLDADAPGNTPNSETSKTALQLLQGMTVAEGKIKQERDGLVTLLQQHEDEE